jgi:hypothetical protein
VNGEVLDIKSYQMSNERPLHSLVVQEASRMAREWRAKKITSDKVNAATAEIILAP